MYILKHSISLKPQKLKTTMNQTFKIHNQMTDKQGVSSTELFNRIALSLIPSIGSVSIKNLVGYCGSVNEIFKSKSSTLLAVPGIGPKMAKEILEKAYIPKAEREFKFIEKNNIDVLFFLDQNYPIRLKECNDGPALVYCKGNFTANQNKVLSVIGTRKATHYAKDIIASIIEELSSLDILIVSGLAYGVDICAHRSALDNNLTTLGVCGHGLDKIYPAVHKKTANRMLENGGLMTEFASQGRTDKENFPRRNRIIAGISDATLVIETGLSGGSMITAYQAHSYERTIMAVPGRSIDKFSIGCNLLIKTEVAHLVENGKDVKKVLGWDDDKPNTIQRKLFLDLSQDEMHIVGLFDEKKELNIDELKHKSKLNFSITAMVLLSLELKGLLKPIPGNKIRLL